MTAQNVVLMLRNGSGFVKRPNPCVAAARLMAAGLEAPVARGVRITRPAGAPSGTAIPPVRDGRWDAAGVRERQALRSTP